MERLPLTLRCVGLAALSLVAFAPAFASHPQMDEAHADQAGLDNQAFGALLGALSHGDKAAQAELLSRVADLPASKLVGTVASIPLARYEVDARPNAIGLRRIAYAIVSDAAGDNRHLRTVEFEFASSPDAVQASCAKFDTARASLGLDTQYPPPPIPSLPPTPNVSRTEGVEYRQEDLLVLGHVEAGISTDNVAKPCLTRAWMLFHEPAKDGATATRSREAGFRRGFQWSALQAFVGAREGNYIQGSRLLSEQIGSALSIPDGLDQRPQRSWPLANGYVLTIGCRQHSCPEKGAVISDASGLVVRTALISFKCVDRSCGRAPMLTIFKNPAQMGGRDDQEMLDEALLEWAHARVPRIPLEIVELP